MCIFLIKFATATAAAISKLNLSDRTSHYQPTFPGTNTKQEPFRLQEPLHPSTHIYVPIIISMHMPHVYVLLIELDLQFTSRPEFKSVDKCKRIPSTTYNHSRPVPYQI